jgi:O-6-methylguanine DNA methyltransferase
LRRISFNDSVYAMTSTIPMGKVTTYGAIARAVGSPRAARAVGNALAACSNPALPCHRVIRADGHLGGGYGGEGTKRKARLLGREGIRLSTGKIDLSKYLFVDF